MPVNLRALLEEMIEKDASDLHLVAGERPKLRVDGDIVNASTDEVMTPKDTLSLAYSVLTENQKKRFETENELDFSFGIQNLARFRGNAFKQRGCVSVVIRQIPFSVKTFQELGLPNVVAQLADRPRGLVLVTGPTGSGKSTTLAAIINKINREKPIHVITIEDPIEYLHPHAMATINQREVGSDTQTFALALRAALRQAPKVILVGEMRDVETISIALEASETGHLVLSTLHTIDAAKTIDRIVGVFPKNEERQIRTRFSQAFKWVVSQRLVPKRGGGRVAVCEVLRANSRTREYVQEGEREGKSLVDAMSDGRLEGMQTFDSELERLINNETIDREVGLSYATNRTNLLLRLETMGEPTAAMPSLKSMQAQAAGRKTASFSPPSEMDGLLER